MTVWQWLHFRFGLPKPLFEPLAVERLYLDNYFSIAKARASTSATGRCSPPSEAMHDCLPYYTDLFDQMKAQSHEEHRVEAVTAAHPAG